MHRRKVAKDQCLRRWRSSGLEARTDEIVAAVEVEKASNDWTKSGGDYIPQPLTWLRQGRWEAVEAGSSSTEWGALL